MRSDPLVLTLQILHYARNRLHSLIIRPRKPQLILQRLRRIEVVRKRLDMLLSSGTSVQDRNMRPIHLVPRERVEVNSKSLHIHPPMRRKAHPINAEQRPRLVHHVRDGPHIVDPTQDVTHMRARDELDLRPEQRFQILRREFELGLGGLPPLDRQVETVR